jgi:hypothetical protein
MAERIVTAFVLAFYGYATVGSLFAIAFEAFPTLSVSGNATEGSPPASYLLCAAGKHGADSHVTPFAGKAVQLRGTLILEMWAK